MAVTPEATEHVDRLIQHIAEVNAGLIPADSPVDFIRSDWEPDENGRPGWFGPNWDPDEATIDSAQEAQNQNAAIANEGTGESDTTISPPAA